MKTHMIDHIETERHTMFRRSTESVKTELQALCERVEGDMMVHVREIHDFLARDYLAVLVGVESDPQVPGLPSSDRVLRTEMQPILHDAAQWFIVSTSDDNNLFKDESLVEGPSSRAADDDDIENLAATQLHEESEVGARGRDDVETKSEPAI